ncbi:MAG: hypothetical protein GWN67_16585 [Phycisphaerae bacterium]|nr:hypothetical protein [Phycisphaerae bacterium]NIR67474.1 hypothetical protein [candidate division Zixibacteria bacterium]NIS52771.1 hypothetical protein [Phycisphaerae bacterium]NIU08227.1 hypothetical protein [Phycisphaerae bacterium]NIU57945.1 hypothetical protein [Phycisphaerae bacterium]
MKTNGKSTLGILVVVVVLLFAALAVGIGVKLSQPHRAESEPKVEKQQIKPAETRPQEKEEIKQSEMTQEDKEFLLWLDEEIARLEEEEATEAMAAEEEPEDIPVAEPVKEEVQETKSFGGWRDVWANLNLTEEEQARLREGFKLAIQRWQNISPEEREAETARLREMGERWESMSEEERREASERMRDRFEEWRQSEEVELPRLSLD